MNYEYSGGSTSPVDPPSRASSAWERSRKCTAAETRRDGAYGVKVIRKVYIGRKKPPPAGEAAGSRTKPVVKRRGSWLDRKARQITMQPRGRRQSPVANPLISTEYRIRLGYPLTATSISARPRLVVVVEELGKRRWRAG